MCAHSSLLVCINTAGMHDFTSWTPPIALYGYSIHGWIPLIPSHPNLVSLCHVQWEGTQSIQLVGISEQFHGNRNY